MKQSYFFFWSILFVFSACQAPLVPEPEEPANASVDMGQYTLSAESAALSPYFSATALVFVDPAGDEITFRQMQPLASQNKRYTQSFDSPLQAGAKVDYNYQGEEVEFVFISQQPGSRFRVVVRPYICDDPRLATQGFVYESLTVKGEGFNDGDIYLRTPTLVMRGNPRTSCGDGRFIGRLERQGRTFDNVYTQRQYLGEREFLQVYYNTAQGIVAFETRLWSGVLDRVE